MGLGGEETKPNSLFITRFLSRTRLASLEQWDRRVHNPGIDSTVHVDWCCGWIWLEVRYFLPNGITEMLKFRVRMKGFTYRPPFSRVWCLSVCPFLPNCAGSLFLGTWWSGWAGGLPARRTPFKTELPITVRWVILYSHRDCSVGTSFLHSERFKFTGCVFLTQTQMCSIHLFGCGPRRACDVLCQFVCGCQICEA